MSVIKLFISQPMRNRTNEDILAERDAILKEFQEKHPDDEVREVPSYDPQLKGHPPLYALGFSFQMMAQADYVIFAPNWEAARGCRLEYEACLEYDVDCINLSANEIPEA